jgi:4-hydroxy-3-polyprenylbenzoate decarboxylase
MMKQRLVAAVTGASGSLLAKCIVEKSQFPIVLVASDWGKRVYETECGPFQTLAEKAAEVNDNGDLFAPIASGSTETVGMIVAPCSASTLARIAHGLGDDLIARAAHCHLKEQRKLILCLRESPLTLIDINNAAAAAAAGAMIMPVSFPFYMMKDRDPSTVTLLELMNVFAERALSLFGQKPSVSWEDIR